MAKPCPACEGTEFEHVIEFGDTPFSGLFRSDPGEPLTWTPLAFELCGQCGLVCQIGVPSHRDYEEVERTTAAQFPAYGEKLLAKISSLGVETDDLVLEIGSNDGAFLKRMAGAGFRRLTGIEPSRSLADRASASGFAVLNDYFTAESGARLRAANGPAQAVVCRHTLEHVPDPLGFLSAVHEVLDPEHGVALIEVPDGAVIPEHLNVQEFWDEHLYYFSSANLVQLIERAGMKVLEVEVQPHLDTRNLLAWCTARAEGEPARPAGADPAPVALWRGLAVAWEAYCGRLAEAVRAAPRPLYLIGASHPQCNFTNYTRIGALVDYFIDDDPSKIGRFPPITEGCPCIISTVQFEATARAGTVLKTGFGYPQWTARVCEHAARQGMRTMDPREFVGPRP